MKMNKITMVNPGQIVKRGWKGLKSTQAVCNFAMKHKVPSVYWKKPGTTKKVFLVEFDHFCETWREYKKTTVKSTTRKPIRKSATTSKTTKTYKRTTARKPIARKRTTYRAKTRTTRR